MSSDAWKKENTIQKNVRLTKNSGIVEALKTASAATGVAESVYIRQAIEEKLLRDGYLQKSEENQ